MASSFAESTREHELMLMLLLPGYAATIGCVAIASLLPAAPLWLGLMPLLAVVGWAQIGTG